uniref:Uncharacterized protein n=1 Tax=Panagrolaimus sp. PS1159 TaxID=55785 RepID=A0AC35F733_9BILA
MTDSVVSKKWKENPKLELWNKQSDFGLKSLRLIDKADYSSSNTTNNSFLSLRIEAYENSVGAASDKFDDKMKEKKWEKTKQIFAASKFVIEVTS